MMVPRDPLDSVVFLDIDGVLNNPGCYMRYSAAMEAEDTAVEEDAGLSDRRDRNRHVHLLFHPPSVAALNAITDQAKARIVLSSSWRMHYWRRREEFSALLERVGVRSPVIDFTPFRGEAGEQRGDEIRMWLERNCDRPRSILVLDDDSDMRGVEPWFVQTRGSVGLCDADVPRAARILCGRRWNERRTP